MALLGFTLPPDSGEKLTLGTYFNCIMMMVASSVVLTVVVLNYHHRTAETHEMPPWVRTLFLQWLPWILHMSRPGKPITRKSIIMNNKMNEIEMKKNSSRSLLANVLDMDDDFRIMPSASGFTAAAAPGGFIRVNGNPLTMDPSDIIKPMAPPPMSPYPGGPGTPTPQLANSHSGSAAGVAAGTGGTCHAHTCSATANRELQSILKELKFITNRMKMRDEEEDIIMDWKFAAMVIDRFCLITFTAFTIITTIAVLLSAPHIIVA